MLPRERGRFLAWMRLFCAVQINRILIMMRKALSAWVSAVLLVAAPVAFAELAPAKQDSSVQAFGANTGIFTRSDLAKARPVVARHAMVASSQHLAT
ncbi:MAG: hypothetical protein ABI268_10975, partial [Rhodanobacter sp.]